MGTKEVVYTKIGNKKYKIRNIYKIPVNVGALIYEHINDVHIVISLWLDCDIDIVKRCNINQLTALYNVLMNRYKDTTMKIKTRNLIDIDNMIVEQYTDMDYILSENPNPIVAGYKLIGLFYTKKPRKINTGYCLCFLSFIMSWKMEIQKEYPEIFSPGSKKGSPHPWGWYHLLHEMCKNDIEKVDYWYKQSYQRLFVFLTYNLYNQEDGKER